MTFLKDKRGLTFSILSGIMIGTSYIPFPPWALFFAFCPLWTLFLKETNPKKIFFYGWVTQFVLAFIGFHWLPTPIIEFGNLPPIIGILGFALFCTLANLHIPFAGLAWFFLKKYSPRPLNPFQSVFALALLTALFEKLNPQLFPWYMGYAWYYGDFPAYQLADTIGVTGLSTLTFLINAWLLFIILNIRERRIFRKHVVYLVLFFSFINGTGLLKNHYWKDKADSFLDVLLVQPNIGNQEKQWQIYGAQFKDKIVQKHLEISAKALENKKADLMIWPETSMPEYMQEEYNGLPNVQKVFRFLRDHHIGLLTGAYLKNITTQKDSNALILYDKNAVGLGSFKKHILLAFGEYLPLSYYFPSLLNFFPTVADFERGRGPHVLDFHGIEIGPQICYEGLHPWFTKGLEKQGADIFVNVTNDSWFGHTFEPYQHLYMTTMRAVEFRRPMIRVTNTGISAVAMPTGKIIAFSPQKQEWAQIVRVPYLKNPPQTFYSRFLYLDHILVVFAVLLIFRLDLLTKTLIIKYRSHKP